MVEKLKVGPYEIGLLPLFQGPLPAILSGTAEEPLAALLNQTEPIHAAFVENAPLGRTGSPDDVAGVALFLASDDASWMTGDLVRVDGGAHTKRYPEMAKILGAIDG
jgi:enoyl-[acyl-carrier-protein] reductase (NADH)